MDFAEILADSVEILVYFVEISIEFANILKNVDYTETLLEYSSMILVDFAKKIQILQGYWQALLEKWRV